MLTYNSPIIKCLFVYTSCKTFGEILTLLIKLLFLSEKTLANVYHDHMCLIKCLTLHQNVLKVV